MSNTWLDILISNLFRSLTSISVAVTFSFIIMIGVGRPLIYWLGHRKNMRWSPREDTPDTHLQKAGIPSMGGIGIIGSGIVGFLISLTFSNIFLNIAIPAAIKNSFPLGSLLQFSPQLTLNSSLAYFIILPAFVASNALLGYIDDYSKATSKGGLSSKSKLVGQLSLTLLFIVTLEVVQLKTSLSSGLIESELFDFWYVPLFALLLIIGTSNAVNLTDGIDGLAAGLSVQIGLTSVFLAPEFSSIASSFAPLSTCLLWAALGGACLGFLAFNKYPARVFMGDTGSLALGAALGAGAILTRTVWLLPFIGFIFYVEMFSVIAQVIYFKYTRRKFGEGKRLFKRAPLHHHFELCGWSEWRVVLTFWGVNLATTIVGLALWKMGFLPRFP